MAKEGTKEERKAAKKAAKAAAAAADASSMSVDVAATSPTPQATTSAAPIGAQAAAAPAGVLSSEEQLGSSSSSSKKDKKKSSHKVKAAVEAGSVADVTMDLDGGAADDDKEIDMSTISPIARPLAEKKLSKKVFKTIKKASKSRGHVKRGVKEVVKGLRKGEKGLVILAGDISPMDILSHIPILCEEQNVPYIFVASKEALGAASSTKRPTSTVMVCPDGGKLAKKKGTGAEMKEDYKDEFETVEKEVRRLGEKLVMG